MNCPTPQITKPYLVISVRLRRRASEDFLSYENATSRTHTQTHSTGGSIRLVFPYVNKIRVAPLRHTDVCVCVCVHCSPLITCGYRMHLKPIVCDLCGIYRNTRVIWFLICPCGGAERETVVNNFNDVTIYHVYVDSFAHLCRSVAAPPIDPDFHIKILCIGSTKTTCYSIFYQIFSSKEWKISGQLHNVVQISKQSYHNDDNVSWRRRRPVDSLCIWCRQRKLQNKHKTHVDSTWHSGHKRSPNTTTTIFYEITWKTLSGRYSFGRIGRSNTLLTDELKVSSPNRSEWDDSR